MAENSDRVGSYVLAELHKIRDNHPLVGDTRGQGFFIGIEFVRNKETKEPAPELVPKVMEKLKDRQILVGKGGSNGNVIRILPPLCMTMEDAHYFIANLTEILAEIH